MEHVLPEIRQRVELTAESTDKLASWNGSVSVKLVSRSAKLPSSGNTFA